MKRFFFAVLAVAALALVVSDATAVERSCSKQIQDGYRKNVLWPYPDICPDRGHVRAPFNLMVQNGWRRQNLLGEHHFSATTGELTTAGQLKVHWVMTQAPEQYRQVFVERSLDPEVTAKRVAAARAYAAEVALDGQTPMVRDTHLISEGRPAALVDFINVSFQESMPHPVLPKNSLGESGN